MKRILLILTACLSLSGCSWIALGIAASTIPDQKLSFRLDGERFETTEEVTGTLRIMEINGEGFALSLGESAWATDNTMNGLKIGLNCGFFEGKLKEDQEYHYTSDDKMDFYPFFSYTEIVPEELASGTIINHQETVWFNAVEGWIEITRINKKKQIVDGRFEFTAVCDDPADGRTLKVTSGRFQDYPYMVVSD